MTRTDRARRYMEILDAHDLSNSSINWEIMDELTEEELYDDAAISKQIAIIKKSDERFENSPNKYPERIMRYVRATLGLAEYDDSQDARINRLNQDEVFKKVCEWHGLIGFDGHIKSWIEDVYGIDLSKGREN